MAFAIRSDESHKVWYALESTFGTAIALSGTSYKEIEFQKGQFFDLGVNKTSLAQNRGSRVFTLADLFHDNFTGPVGFAFETYCSRDRAADFIYLVTQNRVSQAGTSDRQKVYRLHTSQPDFTANAGMFVTMIWDSPESGKDVRLTSGILRELTLSWDKSGAGESNLVKMSGVFLFKKYEIDQTFSGSGSARDITLAYRAHSFTLEFAFNAVTISSANWERFALTLNNNAIGIDRDSSGNPVTYFLNPGDNGLTASAETWYTGNYVNAITDYSAGNTVTLTLSTGSSGVTGYFNIVAKGKITNNPLAASNGQLRIPMEFTLGDSAAAQNDGCVITIADGINQT